MNHSRLYGSSVSFRESIIVDLPMMHLVWPTSRQKRYTTFLGLIVCKTFPVFMRKTATKLPCPSSLPAEKSLESSCENDICG